MVSRKFTRESIYRTQFPEHLPRPLRLDCVEGEFNSILALFDHPIRPRQHLLWNYEADLLGSLEIDHQLEFRRPFDRKISRLGAFQDFVHVGGDAPVAARMSAP
jgi:hypothetical protein